MNTKSSKAKGRKLQNNVRDLLREAYPSLLDDDIKSQTMGMAGEDIVLSPAAQAKILYSFECKNVEKLSIWNAIDQAKTNCGERVPIVVFKKNQREAYVAFKLDHFITMVKENVQ